MLSAIICSIVAIFCTDSEREALCGWVSGIVGESIFIAEYLLV